MGPPGGKKGYCTRSAYWYNWEPYEGLLYKLWPVWGCRSCIELARSSCWGLWSPGNFKQSFLGIPNILSSRGWRFLWWSREEEIYCWMSGTTSHLLKMCPGQNLVLQTITSRSSGGGQVWSSLLKRRRKSLRRRESLVKAGWRSLWTTPRSNLPLLCQQEEHNISNYQNKARTVPHLGYHFLLSPIHPPKRPRASTKGRTFVV